MHIFKALILFSISGLSFYYSVIINFKQSYIHQQWKTWCVEQNRLFRVEKQYQAQNLAIQSAIEIFLKNYFNFYIYCIWLNKEHFRTVLSCLCFCNGGWSSSSWKLCFFVFLMSHWDTSGANFSPAFCLLANETVHICIWTPLTLGLCSVKLIVS